MDATERDATTRLPSRRQLFAREPGWQFSLMLALEVVFLFVAIPALSAGDVDRSVVTLLQLALAGIAIALLARSAPLRLALATSFGLALLSRFLPGLLPHAITLGLAFAYNVLVTAAMARAVFGAGDVNHHRIAGAVFVYLNIMLLFTTAYAGLTFVSPQAVSGLSSRPSAHAAELLHFSLTRLTSIGDGTIAARSPLAWSLADAETVIGQLFPTILLSRLVGLHLSRNRQGRVTTPAGR